MDKISEVVRNPSFQRFCTCTRSFTMLQLVGETCSIHCNRLHMQNRCCIVEPMNFSIEIHIKLPFSRNSVSCLNMFNIWHVVSTCQPVPVTTKTCGGSLITPDCSTPTREQLILWARFSLHTVLFFQHPLSYSSSWQFTYNAICWRSTLPSYKR